MAASRGEELEDLPRMSLSAFGSLLPGGGRTYRHRIGRSRSNLLVPVKCSSVVAGADKWGPAWIFLY